MTQDTNAAPPPPAQEPVKKSRLSGAAQDAKKSPQMKMVAIAFFSVLCLGALVGLFFLIRSMSTATPTPRPIELAAPAQAGVPHIMMVHEIREILVNLRAPAGRRPPYLKLAVGLEVGVADEAAEKKTRDTLTQQEALIKDQFYVYLRDLDLSDLQGSEGMQRLREELLERVNVVTAPLQISNVLFLEFFVQ